MGYVQYRSGRKNHGQISIRADRTCRGSLLTAATTRYHGIAQAGLLIGALALLLLSPGLAVAAGIYDPGTLLFQTADQSMWDTGGATVLSYSGFLGTTWNASTGALGGIGGQENDPVPGTGGSVTVTVLNPLWVAWNACQPFSFIHSCGSEPAKHVTKTIANPIPTQFIDSREGATLDASTTGKVGFDVAAAFNSGSVNADLSYNATAKLPGAIAAGTVINLNPASSMAGVHDLSTIFPTASGHVNGILDTSVSFGAEGCQAPFGCVSGNGGFDINATVPIVSFNEADSLGQIKVLGVGNPSLFQFGSPIDINSGLFEFGNLTVNVPDLKTDGAFNPADNTLTAGGISPFLNIRADLDGLALAAAGIPSITGLSIDVGPASIGYDVINVLAGPDINIVQSFTLTPTLMTKLDFSAPVNVAGVGTTSSYTGAWDSLPDITFLGSDPVTVTPTFFVQAQLHNETGLGIAGAFSVDALDAFASINVGPLSFDIASFGPVFHFDATTGTLALPPILDKSFALGGFNQVNGAPIVFDSTGVHLKTDDSADFAASLKTGSPAILSQLVENPGNDFTLAFDYEFVTGTGALEVMLQDGDKSLDLADLFGSGPEGAFTHFSQSYAFSDLCANFIGVTCDASTIFKLAFNFDDPGHEGSILKLDNISLTDALDESLLLNGDFQTGSLANWQINDDQHVAISEEAKLIAAPEPAAILLFLPGLAGLAMMRRRHQRQRAAPALAA